jgi:hypothetical protein
MPDDSSAGGGDQTDSSLLSSADANPTGGASADAAQTTPWTHRIFADDTGKLSDGWINHLPDEYADLRAYAANSNDLLGLLQRGKSNQTAAMAKTEGMIRIPGENATPEERAAFNAALKIPEAPDGYQVPKIEGLPEGFALDPDTVSTLHGLGVSQPQLEGLLQLEQRRSEQQALAQETAQKQWLESERETLKRDFGNQLGEKTALANRAAQTFGLDPNNPIFGSAEVVKAFAAIGAAISEDKLVSSESMKNQLSPESAADDIMRNENNPDYAAYRDQSHARHKEVVAKVNDLMQKAYPSA